MVKDDQKRKMKIDIICPLYNGEYYIEKLHKSLESQKNVCIGSINYVITDTNDGSKELLDGLNVSTYRVIDKKEFSHSKTREQMAMSCDGDILVFITQDVIIKRLNWLEELTKDIIEGTCEAAYSRQICDSNCMEKYIREKNYPEEEAIKSKEDIEKLGLNTFFFSDVACAINAKVYRDLKGYDNKDLPTSEDMYIAYKLIMNGYSIKYCSKSEVIHYHDLSLRELYDRYKLCGEFFKQESYLNGYGTNESGAALALYVCKRALEEKNVSVLIKIIPNMAVRFIGMKAGKYL